MGTRGAVPTNAVAEERGRPDGTTRDTALLSAGTAVSRLTGVLRVVMVGAVLGPTYLGNAYEVSNSLPNLVYYGFLAGSLTSAIVVPALLRAAGRLAEIAGDASGIALVAISRAVADAAGEGWQRVIVTRTPSSEAMIEAALALAD